MSNISIEKRRYFNALILQELIKERKMKIVHPIEHPKASAIKLVDALEDICAIGARIDKNSDIVYQVLINV